MTVHDRLHVGPLLVDLAVDEALAVEPVLGRRNRHAVEIVGEQILFGDEHRRQMARHHVLLRVLVVPDAEVTERVDDAVLEEDLVADEQILDQRRIEGFVFGHRLQLITASM